MFLFDLHLRISNIRLILVLYLFGNFFYINPNITMVLLLLFPYSSVIQKPISEYNSITFEH